MNRRSIGAVVLGCAILIAPVSARAAGPHEPRGDIVITYDGELNRSHGVRSGRGTARSPYVISGWQVHNLTIKDTTRAIRIENNRITGTLTLDWVGRSIVVRNNEIGDLRVNQNVPRWGDPTAGVVTKNKIGVVGQLRHYDGAFTHNTVGAPQTGTLSSAYPDTRAVNFDGFNRATFTRNVIYGYVDARLHGHHHSSSYGMASHAHARGPHDAHDSDHTKRFHEVVIEANTIYTSAPYALAYLDTNHAANDRTANSETHPWLNAPHVHNTRVHVMDNRLNGAGLKVDVFNAADEKHAATRRGTLHVMGNRVVLQRDLTDPFRVLQGIEVRTARDITLSLMHNTVQGPPPLIDHPALATVGAQGAGILLNGLDKGLVVISDNRVSNRQFGVRALQLTGSVRWIVRRLATDGVQQPVSYDASVRNAPER